MGELENSRFFFGEPIMKQHVFVGPIKNQVLGVSIENQQVFGGPIRK